MQLKIDENDAREIRNKIQCPFEIGGSLKLVNRRILTIDKLQKSKWYSQVDIPAGLVQFHTHPAVCLDRDARTCAMPTPSITDLLAFARAAWNSETAFHLIFTEDGIYHLFLTHRIRALNRRDFERWFGWVKQRLEAYRHKRLVTKSTYPRFRKEYLSLAKECGFHIVLGSLHANDIIVPLQQIQFFSEIDSILSEDISGKSTLYRTPTQSTKQTLPHITQLETDPIWIPFRS